MRIAFISDIHGVAAALERALDAADSLGYDRLVLLGDLLYHGPRNGVPGFYDPARVAEKLNSLKGRIVAVRGNCDAEVDQKMLDFPIMGDYALIDAGREVFFLTHGHLWNAAKTPPSGVCTTLVHGHTHIAGMVQLPDGLKVFNPGSVALPRGGTAPSFGYYDGIGLRVVSLAVDDLHDNRQGGKGELI